MFCVVCLFILCRSLYALFCIYIYIYIFIYTYIIIWALSLYSFNHSFVDINQWYRVILSRNENTVFDILVNTAKINIFLHHCYNFSTLKSIIIYTFIFNNFSKTVIYLCIWLYSFTYVCAKFYITSIIIIQY